MLKLTSKRAFADAELRRYPSEGETRGVSLRCRSDLGIGHLAWVPSSLDAVAFQMCDHGRAVDAVLPSETVDGLTVDVPGHDLVDLFGGQPALLLAGTRFDRYVLILGDSSDHLLEGCPQLVFRE